MCHAALRWQVTAFFSLNNITVSSLEMRNLLLLNQCAMKSLPGQGLVGWLVGWLAGWLVSGWCFFGLLACWSAVHWLAGWLVGG